MSSWLLDTNCCIGLINGRPPQLRHRFELAVGVGDRLLVSSIAVFELWYGVARSERRPANTARLEAFLASPLEVLPFEPEDAMRVGELRAHLRRIGTPIGPYDLLIAAQALRHNLTLVTANTGEFVRVPGLAWEDWS